MDNIKVERIHLEDGRRAERRVKETTPADCVSETVTELYAEEERPLHLSQRVVEKTKPFIYERTYQTIDKDGKITEQKIESADPDVNMRMVEHIGVIRTSSKPDDCVSREEMVEAVVAAVRATKSGNSPVVTPPAKRSVQAEIAERVEAKQFSTFDKVMVGAIVVLVIGLGYVIFWM